MKKRVVVTAMDVVTPIGSTLELFWQNLTNGVSGIERIAHYDPSPYPTQIAGVVKDFDLDDYPHLKKPKRYAKASQFATRASIKALERAGIEGDDRAKGGVFIGTGFGGSPQSEDGYEAFYTQSWRKIPALTVTRAMPNAIANNIAIECGLRAKNLTIANACNSSAEAIGLAYEQIQWGKMPFALCGGSESMLYESMMGAWCKLRVMSTLNETPAGACRPFSQDRDGMVMSEGAAMLVLEDYDFAIARGAKPLAEVIGFASSCDAFHITAPSSEGQALAVNRALDDAKVTGSDVQYISAHGTATKLNDPAETATMKEVFGDLAYDIPMSSIKSMVGHTLGAAGAIEIAALTMTLQHNIIPPTINLDKPDEACDLDYVANEKREKQVDVALSNHFAFGGANCALVLKSV